MCALLPADFRFHAFFFFFVVGDPSTSRVPFHASPSRDGPGRCLFMCILCERGDRVITNRKEEGEKKIYKGSESEAINLTLWYIIHLSFHISSDTLWCIFSLLSSLFLG